MDNREMLLYEGKRLTEEIHRSTKDVTVAADLRTGIVRRLHDDHSMPYSAIAEQFGITAQAIAKAYHRQTDDWRTGR